MAVIDELGAHVSSAGGVRHAPERAAALDATVLQLFTKMASRWHEPELAAEEVAAYRAHAGLHGIRAASTHDSYLINLASPDPVLRARSMQSFDAELRRAALLGIGLVVTHPGNATDDDFESAIARNAEAVQRALESSTDVSVLFETTAGAGRVLGATFEQLARIIDRIPAPRQDRVGVCLDTCHVWAAGYDLRTAYDDVMQRFDDVIGLERIRMFHLNDSVGALGSRRDRHAHIGEGALGDDAFRSLLRDDRFRDIPKLLETPKDDDAVAADRRNLARLRGYRAEGC
ncbi:MAG TPA: deoxyribonuclease IV [Longimicrobiales bacterium]|nr:deoxyribonuclease IV [Longimicrobiales bacterium]